MQISRESTKYSIPVRSKPAALSVIVLILFSYYTLALGQQRTRYTYTSSFVLENKGSTPYNLTEEDATITLFRNDSWQSIIVINSTFSIARETSDEDGNRFAILGLPSSIARNTRLNVSVSYLIETSDRPKPGIDLKEAGAMADIPLDLIEKYTAESETFTTNNETIRELAKGLVANETTVLNATIRLLHWIVDNVSYGNFDYPHYPYETLIMKRGDCDDQAILLITMLRIVGVPAFLQVGVVFSEGIQGEKTSWNGHLKSQQKGVGWHGWVVAYIPPWGWIPIDLTLVSPRDPFSMIDNAPEYEAFIVSALNVSKQNYVGDTRKAMEDIIGSELYITSSDYGAKASENSPLTPLHYALLGMSAATAIIVITFVFVRRRRSTAKNIL